MAKTTPKPTLIDWFCRVCWRHGVASKSASDERAPETIVFLLHDAEQRIDSSAFCRKPAIMWKVRPRVPTAAEKRAAANKAARGGATT